MKAIYIYKTYLYMVKSYCWEAIDIKIIFTEFNQSAGLYVKSYGFEDISCNAHWGWGRRDAFILHYVMAGEGFFNAHKVKSGQGFLITPNMMHEYHSSKDRPWKYFWVIFSGEDAATICEKYIDADKNNIFDFARFELKVIDLVTNIMAGARRFTESQALGYFYLLISCHESATEFVGNHHIQLAKKYMKTHIYRHIAITEVARTLGISDRYMYNLFIKHLGISPKQYLNNLKIDHAQSLLKTTNDTISEIATSIGFYDVLTFSRFFKKHVGISPKEFRRRNKSKI